MKKCKYCEKEFEPKHHLNKYCSKYCLDRMRKIEKRINDKKRHGTDEPRKCKGCGKTMRFYNMRLYCKKCKMIRKM